MGCPVGAARRRGSSGSAPFPWHRPASGSLARVVRLDCGKLIGDAPLRVQRVVGVLQPEEIALGLPEEPAQTKIAVGGDVSQPADDPVNAISGYADCLRQLVLAEADFVQELVFED